MRRKELEEMLDSTNVIEEELKLRHINYDKIERHLTFLRNQIKILIEKTDESL